MRDRTLAQHLEVNESKAHPRSKTLPDSQKFYRIKMVTAFFSQENRSKRLMDFGKFLN